MTDFKYEKLFQYSKDTTEYIKLESNPIQSYEVNGKKIINVTKDILEDCNELKKISINSVAICANDAENYPEDSFENMIEFAKKNKFSFPYLNDETQEIAKTYDAVCTPDFFGYNKNLELQYRGRLRELKNLIPVRSGESDLLKAMKQIAEIGKGPENQIPSAGCSIKWKR